MDQSSIVTRAGASTTRVLVLPKMINMNTLKTLYSSTDFPVLVLVCSVLAPALIVTFFGIPGVIFKFRALKFDRVGPLSMLLSVRVMRELHSPRMRVGGGRALS